MLKRLWELAGVKRRFPALHRLAVLVYLFRPLSAHQWYIVSWNAHTTLIRLLCRLSGRPGRPSPEFARTGLARGRIDDGGLRDLAASIPRAPLKGFDPHDAVPGYFSYVNAYDNTKLKSGHATYVLGEEQLQAVHRTLRSLAEPIAAELGTPWRVLNIRCPLTRAVEMDTEYYGWHTDGCPWDILKFMIYLTPAGEETGTMAYKDHDGAVRYLEGPPGSWFMFKNSVLTHRGVPPRSGERLVIEVTFAPALRHDQYPACGGSTGQYPKFPWTRTPRPVPSAA